MAQHHKRLAKQYRRESKMTAIEHSPVGYRPAFDEGADLIHWAGILDHLSEIVLDNLDSLVKAERGNFRVECDLDLLGRQVKASMPIGNIVRARRALA